jgi:glutathione S-transferase
MASVARLGAGLTARSIGTRPEKTLEVYDFEGCPFCRKVRDALSELDLEALIKPCPKGGARFRPELKERGGKTQFPYLVDPNTGREMYESADIISYLHGEYGDGSLSPTLAIDFVANTSSMFASLWRPHRGGRARPSQAPAEPLQLWSFEASPYCRLVREVLCELEVPYIVHNVAKRSRERAAFRERSGRMMVPYLVDPNTGTEMFESADIVRYLQDTYAESAA